MKTIPLASLALAAAACTITPDGGGGIKITPALGLSHGPESLDKIGSFTDPTTGVEYDLYDADGDGTADFAADDEGRMYFVTSSDDAMLTAPVERGAVTAEPALPEVQTPTLALYVNEPEVGAPVAFEQSAAAYLAELGLASLSPGVPSFSGGSFLVPAAFEWDGVGAPRLDVTVWWDPRLAMPRAPEHPDLAYEMYALTEGPASTLGLLTYRVVGDAGDVVAWLAGFGFEEIAFDDVALEDGQSVDVLVILALEAGGALGFADGQLVWQTTFD